MNKALLRRTHAIRPSQQGGRAVAHRPSVRLIGEAKNGRSTNPQGAGIWPIAAEQELAYYAACVFEPADIVEVRRLPSGRSTWHEAGRLARVARVLFRDNQRGEHIYIGANPRRIAGGTRSKDVVCARCLFVDFDGIGPGAARNRWHDAGLPTPTLTIASGHGVHTYWRLADPITDLSQWTALQKKLIALLDSDKAIHDPPRIMRVPGFINHKEPVAMCRIIAAEEERTYDVKSLMPVLSSAEVEQKDVNKSKSLVTFGAQSKMLFPKGLSIMERAASTASKWPGVGKGQRNSKAFQNAAYLTKNLGLTEGEAWPILKAWNRKNRPPLPEWELRQAVRNASIYGRHPVDKEAA